MKFSLFYIVIFIFFSCSIPSKQDTSNVYKAVKTSKKIVVDGVLNEEMWKHAETTSFHHFYRIIKPTDKQKTSFKMVWDDENLYLAFQCSDKFINAKETKRDGETYLDDCVELFITPTPESNKMHFAIEVNVNKVSNDIVYIENYYKGEKGVIKALNPDFKCGVQLIGTLNNNHDEDEGWTMELAMPLINFWGLDNFQPAEIGNKWSFLVIRQERNEDEIGRRIASTNFKIDNINTIHNSKKFGFFEFVGEK